MECACGQQLTLWISVEKLVDKSPKKSSRAMSFSLKDKSLSGAREADLFAALSSAVDELDARIEALEYQLLSLISLADQPLAPSELVERLRALRAEIRNEIRDEEPT